MGSYVYKPNNADFYVIKLHTTDGESVAWYLQQLCEIGEEYLGEFQSGKKLFFPQTLSGESN